MEHILNYACWKGCIKESYAYQQRKEEQLLAEFEFKESLKALWRPTINEPIDFKPKSLGNKGYFLPGKVINIDQKY